MLNPNKTKGIAEKNKSSDILSPVINTDINPIIIKRKRKKYRRLSWLNCLKTNNEVRKININFVINIPITGLSLKGPVNLSPRDGYPKISLPVKYWIHTSTIIKISNNPKDNKKLLMAALELKIQK